MREKTRLHELIAAFVTDANHQEKIIDEALYALMALIAGIMTVVNVFTSYRMLMISTLVFALLCIADEILVLFGGTGQKVATILFRIEIILLISFFIICGDPEGFSALWAAMIPAFAMLVYRRDTGTVLSGIMFVILAFFFWTPIGREFLLFDYTSSFMLRFPIFYITMFIVSFAVETIRTIAIENSSFLQNHDPLTNALNRRGFEEKVREAIEGNKSGRIGFAIFDLDFFKNVNDTYGHFTGDLVLKDSAKAIETLSGFPICRWGGEEFAFVDPEGVITQEIGDELCRNFEQHKIIIDDVCIPLTVSIGIAVMDCQKNLTPDDMCREADKGLYEAKETGRNKCVFRNL